LAVSIDNYEPRPMSPRVGVYPLRTMSKIAGNIASGGGGLRVELQISPSQAAYHGVASSWLIGTQAVFSYSIQFLTGTEGGALIVRLSDDGVNFDFWQQFPIYPGSRASVGHDIKLVGWAASFSLISWAGVVRTMRGYVAVEA